MRGGGAEGSFNTDTYLMNPEMIQGRTKPKEFRPERCKRQAKGHC
jgi:hypothetical protein